MKSMQIQKVAILSHNINSGIIDIGYIKNTSQNDTAANTGGTIIAKTSIILINCWF